MPGFLFIYSTRLFGLIFLYLCDATYQNEAFAAILFPFTTDLLNKCTFFCFIQKNLVVKYCMRCQFMKIEFTFGFMIIIIIIL